MLLTVKEVDPDEPIYLYLDSTLNRATLEGWLLRDGSQLDGVYLEYIPAFIHGSSSVPEDDCTTPSADTMRGGESKSAGALVSAPLVPSLAHGHDHVPDIFKQLCADLTVGVWGTDPDDGHTAAALVQAGADFVNTDLPRSFSPYSTPTHGTRALRHD